jgi:AAA domain
MFLLSLTVRNYRVHKELTIHFDPARNLIGGPNESGKSTLAEAAHRALFLRAKTGGSLQKEMLSSHSGGEPEVLLCFSAAGTNWELEKRFAASKGSTRLSGNGLPTLKDEEAEAKLAEILKTELAIRANATQLAGTWAHLWIWQGSSGDDPSGQASFHKDTLVQRLQNDGIAAVMQSITDQRVREKIAASYDELFTATGRPKAGSSPEISRLQLADAESSLTRAIETEARLTQAVAEHSRAESDIAEAEAAIPPLKQQLLTTQAKLDQVADLQREEQSQLRAHFTAISTLDAITKADAKIRALHLEIAAARQSLSPAEAVETSHLAAEQTALAANQLGETSHRTAAADVRQIRLSCDLATAYISVFEKSAVHQQLTSRTIDADALRLSINDLRAKYSQLPSLTAKDLAALRQLERDASQSSATLAAIATGIELLETDTTVTLDGESLPTNEIRILTDSCELTIGTSTRLRIRPGGGGTLADARLRAENAQHAWTAALARHSLSDLDHAAAIFEQRQALEQQIAQLDTRWKALGGDALTSELAAAASTLAAAQADCQRRQENPDSHLSPPATLAAARALATDTQEKLAAAEFAEATALQNAEKTRSRRDAAALTVQKHREQLTTSRQSLRDLETRFHVLEDTHGAEAARQLAHSTAAQNAQAVSQQLTATRTALAELAPDALSADLARFTRALQQQETRRRDAENQRLIARDRLTLDGSSDPSADLAHAQARRQSSQERYASDLRRAKAIEKLHLLFSSCREAIDQSLVQPLADRIAIYLQCVFGPGTAVRVNLSDSGIAGIELLRPGFPAFPFANLSGGAKEQVAAATRLAMAEILAADHDGCLPILFDDAFAYADRDRVAALQRMLDLAARRGLQIILLTCTPSDYSALGAHEVRL